MSEEVIDIPLTDEEIARIESGEKVKILTDDSVEQKYVEIYQDSRGDE